MRLSCLAKSSGLPTLANFVAAAKKLWLWSAAVAFDTALSAQSRRDSPLEALRGVSSLHIVGNMLSRAVLALALASAAAGPFGKKTIKVGDTVPSVEIDLGFPPSKVNVLEYAQGKTLILMGLPGAYTPT